jgi:hypothetical protein
LFAGRQYYPSGGWDDFEGSYDSVDEAKTTLIATRPGDGRKYSRIDWWHVVDSETGERVAGADGPVVIEDEADA